MNPELCSMCRTRPFEGRSVTGWCAVCREAFRRWNSKTIGSTGSNADLIAWVQQRVWYFASKRTKR